MRNARDGQDEVDKGLSSSPIAPVIHPMIATIFSSRKNWLQVLSNRPALTYATRNCSLLT